MQRQAFGRYEVFQRISMGGMAEVFRAIHTPSGTMVALKRILPEVSEDEEFIKMFEDEARIASQLEHPYIARCLDFGHVDNEWFIAFEFVSGKDLRALFNTCLKNGEAPPLWFLCYVFGRIAETYFQRYGDQSDALAAIAAKNHKNGVDNPFAQMRKDLGFDFCRTVSEKNPYVAPPLKRTDCSLVSDGAAALVLADEETAKAMGKAVRFRAAVQVNDFLPISKRDITQFEGAAQAWAQALRSSDTKLTDLSFVESHDCFTIAELLEY